jgi:hypothetical protein
MLSTDQMPPQIEKVMDSSMGCHISLRLPHRLESPGCRTTHPSFSYPLRLVRLLCPFILILFSAVNGIRDQFPVGNAMTTEVGPIPDTESQHL